MNRMHVLLCGVLLLASLLGGCAERRIPAMDRPEGSLAVAGFTHPKYNWQLLAGYVPQEGRDMDRSVLTQLDQTLVDTLTAHGVLDYLPPANTRQCQEIVTYRNEGERLSALNYWTQVGRCAKVDYLLVPQVLVWKDRKGEDWGATEAASVSLDFYYVDVKAGELAVRKHFEETQLPLSEDLGSAGKFIERGATWVPALRLAQEGIEIKLSEMGL